MPSRRPAIIEEAMKVEIRQQASLPRAQVQFFQWLVLLARGQRCLSPILTSETVTVFSEPH